MRRATTPFLSLLTVLPLLGCDPQVDAEEPVTARDGTCGQVVVPLVVERDERVGEVKAWRAGEQVCVELRVRPDWHITATDLEIRAEGDAPASASPSELTYHRADLWTDSDLRCVSLAEVGGAGGESLTITAHAALAQGDASVATFTADAWSLGPDPAQGNDFGLTSGPCAPAESSPCGHTTHTQSEWGAQCSADNAGCERDKHFMSAFPEGLIVGCGVLTANLVTSKAVEKALPSAGTPRPLLQSEAVAFDGVGDPKVGTSFFGHVVALGLNIGFDAASADPNAYPPLAELIIVDPTSPCFGMSVGQVDEQANLALGNCPASHSAAVLNECAQTINKAFAGGNLCSPALGVPQPPPQ
jgi:hypothetical protein